MTGSGKQAGHVRKTWVDILDSRGSGCRDSSECWTTLVLHGVQVSMVTTPFRNPLDLRGSSTLTSCPLRCRARPHHLGLFSRSHHSADSWCPEIPIRCDKPVLTLGTSECDVFFFPAQLPPMVQCFSSLASTATGNIPLHGRACAEHD